MAWKQRRSQYQDHFPILEILPQKWELSIMQLKYWNPRKTETRSAELYQEELIMEQIQYQTGYIYDLVTCPLYWTMTRSASPEGWTQTMHTQHFNGVGPEAELTQMIQPAEESLDGKRQIWLQPLSPETWCSSYGQGTAVTDNCHTDGTFMCRRWEAIYWIMYEIIVTTGWVACVSKKNRKKEKKPDNYDSRNCEVRCWVTQIRNKKHY